MTRADEWDRAVAALAKGLGMTTTAEGVETKEQLDTITSEGCNEMQGFLFSKPLPAGEMTALLKGHSPKQNLTVVDPRKRA